IFYCRLFGSEDVDLRQLPTAPVTVASSTPPHAPSPTPSSQDTPESDETLIEMKPRIDDDPRGWAKYKELKPDTYKSPRPFGQFRDLPSRSHILNTKSESVSPEHEPAFEGEPQPVFDRLGRRLLYHKLPDDPGERRRSLNTPLSPFPEMDTDMRPRPHLMDVDAINSPFNFNMIMAHAEEQLKNGTLSFNQYNLFIQQMIRMNEVSKLQEAQRRDELESKEAWEQRRRRRRLGSDDEQGDKSPVYSPGSPVNDSSDVNKQPQMSPSDMRFGDIDERFPGGQKTAPRVPPLGSMAPAPEPPPPHWNVNQPRWEPWQHRGPPPSSGPPQMRMMSPGVPYHCPEISSPSNFPVNRWRPPFQNRPNFDGDIENRFDRFSPRSGPGLRFPPSMPLTQQLQHQMQHPPPRITYPPMLVRDRELPPADAKLLEHILQDSMRTINIDGVPREIRFYGDTAIVMMTWDDPREISFQGNVKRRVTFDDRDSILCAINEGYRDFVLDGITHRIRIGAPTRELYIDGKWYECIFGGPPVNIEIGGKLHTVKLDGPQPQVKIGYARKDLVAGKINLIINAKTMVPVFLDAKPQRFDIEGKPHILRFVDALMRVMINGRPFPVEFGGLPKPILVRDKKHFIRFSVLPRWVRPGYVKIVNMEGTRLASPPPHLDAENSNSNMGLSGDESSNDGATDFVQGHKPALPILGNPVAGRGTGGRRLQDSVDTEQARSSPGHYHKDSAGLGLLARPPPTHRTRQAILSNLMERFVKADIVNVVDVSKEENVLSVKKIDLDFATRNELKKSNVFLLLIQQWLRTGWRETLLSTLVDARWLVGTTADKAAREFKNICLNPNVTVTLKDYSCEQERIDHPWRRVFQERELDNISKVMKLVSILSHGNTNIERGFAVNTECIFQNMREQTLISRRCVYDAVTTIGGIDNLNISKSLIHAARNAHLQFKLYENENIEKSQKTTEKRRTSIEIKKLE
ncbi:unnamed protein product, partial [Timema podura]|nr:unnamed protein product [Timema podura]